MSSCFDRLLLFCPRRGCDFVKYGSQRVGIRCVSPSTLRFTYVGFPVIFVGSAVFRDGVRQRWRPHVSNSAGGKVQGTGRRVRI